MSDYTIDPEGVANLDALSDDELLAFYRAHADGLNWDRLFRPEVLGPELAQEATRQLSRYAWHLHLARQDRHDGKIQRATQEEALAQRVYDQLPKWARW